MTRAELHQLIDELPEESVEPAATLLRRAKDPMIAVLDAAPLDDEPLSDNEQAELDAIEAEGDRTGSWIPLESILDEGQGAG